MSNQTVAVKFGPVDGDGLPRPLSVEVLGAFGASGKSAYQVAVDNGFVGTEAAWLASLVPDLSGLVASAEVAIAKVLTQVTYDAIPTPDPATLYLIVG